MTSIIKFHAISGALDDSPPCYILQIDEFRFLLDCGWNENFDMEFMKDLRRYIPQIDAVLLTFPDNLHLGALPYLVGKCGLSCPIYATVPVYKMGQMFMYDLHQSRYNMEEFTLFNLDDVDAAFDKIVQLKYNQTVQMKGKSHGLSIVPMPAGHMIGGTIWKIKKLGEEDIIYAIDFNHKKERHLNGCQIDTIQRPALLITDAFNGIYQQDRRRMRDEKLLTLILETLSNNGNILIAVDTAGRVLELAHMLDQLWKNKSSGLQTNPLCILNNVIYNVVEFAKSQIEWMSDKLMKSFEAIRNNPFQFKNIKLCHSVQEVNRLSPNRKVVLASMPDLECGFARDLFIEWASEPENSIILTSRTGKGSLGRDLYDNGSNRSISLLIKQRVRLEGEELDEYMKTHVDANKIKEEDRYSSSEDELELLSVSKGTYDIVVKQEKVRRSQRKTYPMFPLVDQKIRLDDYGEIINIEDYKSQEEKAAEERIVIPKKEPVVEDDEVEFPTKCIQYWKKLELRANVHYIDFEGRSDGESMQKLIGLVKPRHLILVRGMPDTTAALAKYVRQWTEAKVFTPSKGDIVDATSEGHIFQIRLTDSLVSGLKLQKGRDSELSWIDAKVTNPSKSGANVENMEVDEDKITSDYAHDDLLTLEPIPPKDIPAHNAVFVNELRLSDLKIQLTKHGIDAEFIHGVLYCCNRTLRIKRFNNLKISIEGLLSDNYYKVRNILYSQYAIL